MRRPGSGRTEPLALVKRSVSLSGHQTSLALEPEFWAALEAAARAEGLTVARLIGRIDAGRGERALASACRVYALERAAGTSSSL